MLKTHNGTTERPIFYKLEWTSSTCCRQWVDYLQLSDLDDSEGTLEYRSCTTCASSFRLDRLTSGAFLSSPPNTFPTQSECVLKASQQKNLMRLDFHVPNIKVDWHMPSKAFKAMTFQIKFWGHKIQVGPSRDAGFWNPTLSLEARWIAEGLAVGSSDHPVPTFLIWQHEMDTVIPSCSCGTLYTSQCSVYRSLIESMARSPIDSFKQPLNFSRDKNEFVLNVEPDQLLACLFLFADVYRQFYSGIKKAIPIFIFSFLFVVAIIVYNVQRFLKDF